MGPFAAFLSSIFWALGSGLYGRLASRYSPSAINFYRAILAAPVFLILAGIFQFDGFQFVTWNRVGWLCLSVIFSLVVADSFFFVAIRKVGLIGALSVASIYPVWAALAGWFFKGEHLTLLQIFGLLMTLGGTLVVVRTSPKTHRSDSGEIKTDLGGYGLALMTSFFWATNSFATSKGAVDIPIFVAAGVRMSMALVLCFVVVFFLQGRKGFQVQKSDIRPSVPIMFLEAFGGAGCYIYGMSHSPLAVGSALAALAPVVSMPIEYFSGRESISVVRIIAVIVAFSGGVLLVIH